MIIYIDADACPVKDEAIRVAARHGADVKLVCDGGLMRRREPHVELVIVPEGADAADDWIAAHIAPGDLCVTGDIALAARCLEKGAAAIDHRGQPFTANNIGSALAMRNLMKNLREQGVAGGGGRAYSPRDRSAFLDGIEQAAQRIKHGKPA
ncbi:MAG: YaiI/YqxD family protein [Maricaulaceae bacterium]|nr:YaiI/YqxD family protein [Maricaulaceae bacterium]